jgi:hypothetical protein
MKKITVGYVIQDYDDKGKCISQEFIAGDQVDWEDEYGESIDTPSNHVYFPFNMKQPRQYKVFNIKYAFDDFEEDEDPPEPPKELIFNIEKEDFEPSLELADYISDETGWLVYSFQWEEITK